MSLISKFHQRVFLVTRILFILPALLNSNTFASEPILEQSAGATPETSPAEISAKIQSDLPESSFEKSSTAFLTSDPLSQAQPEAFQLKFEQNTGMDGKIQIEVHGSEAHFQAQRVFQLGALDLLMNYDREHKNLSLHQGIIHWSIQLNPDENIVLKITKQNSDLNMTQSFEFTNEGILKNLSSEEVINGKIRKSNIEYVLIQNRFFKQHASSSITGCSSSSYWDEDYSYDNLLRPTARLVSQRNIFFNKGSLNSWYLETYDYDNPAGPTKTQLSVDTRRLSQDGAITELKDVDKLIQRTERKLVSVYLPGEYPTTKRPSQYFILYLKDKNGNFIPRLITDRRPGHSFDYWLVQGDADDLNHPVDDIPIKTGQSWNGYTISVVTSRVEGLPQVVLRFKKAQEQIDVHYPFEKKIQIERDQWIISDANGLLSFRKFSTQLADGSRQFFDATGRPLSIYEMPDNAQRGGLDVNGLSWNEVEGAERYEILRREYGSLLESDWQKIGEAKEVLQFIDSDVDSQKAYQYHIRALDIQNQTLAMMAPQIRTNYEVQDQGLQPENVLVLINTVQPGYVDIAEAVPDAPKANGKLDPISINQLAQYLGFENALDPSFLTDPDGDGIFHNVKWHVRKDAATGKVEVPLGLYYALRRGIPKEHLVYLDAIPLEERSHMKLDLFNQKVVAPIVNHLKEQNLLSKIKVVVSVFGFPVEMDNSGWGNFTDLVSGAWDTQLNFSLWEALGNRDIQNSRPWRADNGRRFSRILGDTGFLATRIDGPDLASARRMIDDSIWAEENYHFDDRSWLEQSSLRSYVDWKGISALGDGWFQKADFLAQESGYFENERAISAPDFDSTFIQNHSELDQDHDGRLDQAFLSLSWYNVVRYQDVYNFARGAIALNLDSWSGYSFREPLIVGAPNNGENRIWGSNLIAKGAAATLGSVYEPYLDGHTRPDLFAYYLLKGYSFAEAGYYASTNLSVPWKYAFNGDPLYTPFKRPFNNRTEDIFNSKGEKIGTRVWTLEPLGNKEGSRKNFQDFDLQGRLFQEMTDAGILIFHKRDGETVTLGEDAMILGNNQQFWEIPNPDTGESERISLTTHAKKIQVYDAKGNLSQISLIPYNPQDDFFDEFREEKGELRIYRHSELVPGKIDVFDTNGLLLDLDSDGSRKSVQVVQSITTTWWKGQEKLKTEYSYRPLGQIFTEEIFLNGEKKTRILEIQNLYDQSKLKIEYLIDSEKIEKIHWMNGNGEEIATASLNSDGQTFRMFYGRANASMLFEKVEIDGPVEFFHLLNAVPQNDYIQYMQMFYSVLRNYYLYYHQPPLSSDEIDTVFPFSETLSVRSQADLSYQFGVTVNQETEVYHMNFVSYYELLKEISIDESYKDFVGYLAKTDKGETLVFDENSRLRFKRDIHKIQTEYRYQNGVLIGYVETDSSGENRSYLADGTLITEIRNGETLIRVGYLDSKVNSISQAVLLAPKKAIILLAPGTHTLAGASDSSSNYMDLQGVALTFRGDGPRESVIIEGNDEPKRFANINSSDITFENFIFRNFKPILGGGGVLHIDSSKLKVLNCIVEKLNQIQAFYGFETTADIRDTIFNA